MNTSIYGTEAQLTKALRAAAVAFIATLDEASSHPAKADSDENTVIEYDPLTDQPPFTPVPHSSGTDAQQKLASITYLGAIARIYAEEGRGAVSKEISKFAKKAGYAGGNAVNGWNSRPNSPRAVELNEDGERFLNEGSMKSLLADAADLGIELVGEYKTVPSPKK
ncbi:hypothetical protein [Branchiibius sp. NY16-3462-2]|uniref:hypothetical protein n=1 Tax=Branchiibius sp. NY16-3462-2 TaxID=1807500 RepID=UPI000797EE79|nr:hypothetical protein [Branchiibius sp. NY16-3462-2]KYH42885.1 hypothetical protein AZH51_00465 [Branchiibius sp. NY16-3462-2]